jgi:hypothetical protein
MPTATPTFPLVPLGAIAALTIGCTRGSGGATPDDCPPPRPAFSLVVRAFDDRPLADDTTITVSSGGGEEHFAMAAPAAAPQSVFCRAAAERVDCTLWTDGAAQIKVSAVGFAPASAELRAEADECGVVTRDEELLLYPEDPPANAAP